MTASSLPQENSNHFNFQFGFISHVYIFSVDMQSDVIPSQISFIPTRLTSKFKVSGDLITNGKYKANVGHKNRHFVTLNIKLPQIKNNI